MNRAAIVGAGVIGAGWAARFLLNGYQVNVFDPSPECERIVNETVERARTHVTTLQGASPPEGLLSFSHSLDEAVSDVHWVQESLPEDIELKSSV